MVVSYWHEAVEKDFSLLNLERRLYGIEPMRVIKNPIFDGLGDLEELKYAFLPMGMAEIFGVTPKRVFEGRIEGGRSTTLNHIITLDEREFAINIKGSSTRVYSGYTPALNGLDLEAKLREKMAEGAFIDIISDECIMKNRPYGGQRYDWAIDGMKFSNEGLGMPICPIISLQVVPKEFIFHYSSHDNLIGGAPIAQEVRLLPSNVRIAADVGMKHFTINDVVEAERKAFVERFLTSAFDIATLPIRTVRKEKEGVSYLKFDEVNLVKDGVVARDGTIHLADLEGIMRQQDTDGRHFHHTAELTSAHMNFFIESVYHRLNYHSSNELLSANLDFLLERVPKSFSLNTHGDGIIITPV